MKEYFIGVLGASMLFAVSTFLAYRQGEKSTALALSFIVAAAVILPLGGLVRTLPKWDFDLPVAELPNEGEYNKVAKEAYLDGVCLAVSEKFSIAKENLRAYCTGFDFKKMSCECLCVRLQGNAVFSDFDAIKKYLSENLGGCEVEIIIG